MESIVQVLVQGGAVGIALVALWLVYKLTTNHFHETNSIIQKNSDAFVALAGSNVKLCDTIDSLEKTVQSKL